jgi:hypothetical protein
MIKLNLTYKKDIYSSERIYKDSERYGIILFVQNSKIHVVILKKTVE